MIKQSQISPPIRQFLPSDQPLCCDGLVIDGLSRQVYRRGREILLTKGEFQLLYYLVEHKYKTLTHGQIYDAVWGYDLSGSSNSLGVRISALRHKLGEPQIIHNIRNVGYVLKGGGG